MSLNIRDRVKEFRRVPASDLRPNGRNWRQHPPEQLDAIRGMLAEVGFAGAELCRELDDGSLMLIDGHARAEIMGDALVPCLILDVDEAEANKLLATFDPLGAMATADAGALDALLREVDTGSEALQQMLSKLAEDVGIVPESEEWPELGDDSTHTATLKYTDSDIPALKRFLECDELPTNAIGKKILERIQQVVS